MNISKSIPLVYPDITNINKNQITNILLIDNNVENYNIFVDSVNSNTFPIVYSVMSSKDELLALLQSNFTFIPRIGIAFASNPEGSTKMFLDGTSLFLNNEVSPYSTNTQFIINLIKEFNVKNIDYLACDTLCYSNWSHYYQLLTLETGITVGASNNKTGNIKYGGDWIMESTSQDIELIYFTKSIEYYTFLLDTNTPWITNTGDSPRYLLINGITMYISCYGSTILQSINLSNSIPTLTNVVTITPRLSQGAIDGNFLYITQGYQGQYIFKIDLSTNPVTYNQWFNTSTVSSDLKPLGGLVIYDNYLYILCMIYIEPDLFQNAKLILKINLSDKTYTTLINLSENLVFFDLGIYENYMYLSGNDTNANGYIYKINFLDTSPTSTLLASSNTYVPRQFEFFNNYMYIANIKNDESEGYITQINLSNPSVINLYATVNVQQGLTGLAIYQNNIYTTSSFTDSIYQISLPTDPIICFKENSFILTNKGYKPIQELRKGDLVKTLLHGFKPIDLIGKREIFHPANFEVRIKDQLYICSQSEFPELFEPLVITGCHSLLVDNFINEKQKIKAIEVNGDLFITDNKYRLPALTDPRVNVFPEPGKYNIYHLALENEDPLMNYGIYANGLLVETCSIRNLLELSNMTLLD